MSLRYMSLAILLFALGGSAPAFAGWHYVASFGDDGNNCQKATPCSSLEKALAVSSPNDTIVCLDTTVSTWIFIDRSIDIDCSAARHVLREGSTGLNGAAAAIFIDIVVSANDPFRTVRLRGISIQGANNTAKLAARGIDILSAALVSIEDVVVSDVGQQGIIDRRTGGQTQLFITDSTVRFNTGAGIVAAAAAPGVVVLDNVRSENNSYGIAVASGNNVVINRSVFSGNSAAGIEGDAGAQVVVNNSTISHNNFGVVSNQSIRLSNNDIAFNNTAISGSSGTFGNNRFSGNVTMGTAPAALGGASSDLGQQ
jgi:hypothetical protein